ncbi:Heavy-metal-associated domain-containing protein [Marinobacter persicus]|uniref:Heavy-metal-associated domain-containing protein n=1 Tax=Marinobacter persicus TaxID=930118 RepID=A0A1I3VS41_9GAMM|nr:cation transporter [Marinobacter persicus]GHD50313.1 sodium:proton antiporter [Marinobacter persicus]SFJ98055.1 Heavy-metal-associated domain-containing protein [Marinobacter persicus]
MADTCKNSCGCISSRNEPEPRNGLTETASAEWQTRYRIPKMDCPSEERMIRMALDGIDAVKALSFDLQQRELTVMHDGDAGVITDKLQPLNLGTVLESTEQASAEALQNARNSAIDPAREAGTLKILLAINAAMFVIELAIGILAQSTGLIADSMDMFADAAVYGLATYAVGHSVKMQVRAAHVAGVLQLILALGVLLEVGRRFWFGSEPQSTLMIAMAVVALIANSICLYLISAHRKGGAHMKASYIFSANDVIINLGIILAGGLVAVTGSNYPDLIIGTVVGLIVLNGARRILALKS